MQRILRISQTLWTISAQQPFFSFLGILLIIMEFPHCNASMIPHVQGEGVPQQAILFIKEKGQIIFRSLSIHTYVLIYAMQTISPSIGHSRIKIGMVVSCAGRPISGVLGGVFLVKEVLANRDNEITVLILHMTNWLDLYYLLCHLTFLGSYAQHRPHNKAPFSSQHPNPLFPLASLLMDVVLDSSMSWLQPIHPGKNREAAW